jgi:hypothetical protein
MDSRYSNVYIQNKVAYQKLLNTPSPDRVAILNSDSVIVGTKLIGGAMTEDQYLKNKVHNETVFFDKGKNSLWMEEQSDRSQLIENARKLGDVGDIREDMTVNDLTQEDFEKYLSRVMSNRYYARDSNLLNLMGLMETRYGSVRNLQFLEDFYMNLFKGTAFKTTFPEEVMAQEGKLLNDLRKRYNVFVDFPETKTGVIPKREYYTFVDDPNPCHLVKIMKDEFGRDNDGGEEDENQKVKYAFVNTRELGRGKAGTASLFSYYPGEERAGEKLQIAVKLMGDDQFDLTNNAKYLPLRIVYFAERSGAGISRTDRNIRYMFPKSEITKIMENYPGYQTTNLFKTNHDAYPHVALACASDNFSNQTIIHMALEQILDEFGIDNYIKQFDAILCWGTSNKFEQAQTWMNYLKEGLYYAAKSIAEAVDYATAKVDGVNFMEIADAGDLHGHMYNIQKQYFSEIREISDLDNEDKTNFRADWGVPDLPNNNYYSLRFFLGDMIRQILTTLSVLQHPAYAFVHGDLKTKNVFVKKAFPDDKKNRKYIYKIADYDKSSITFNGIRFYNEGMGIVKFISTQWGLSRYDASDTDLATHSGNVDFYVESILDDEYIDIIFEKQDLDRIQIIYQLIIKHIKELNAQDDIEPDEGDNVGMGVGLGEGEGEGEGEIASASGIASSADSAIGSMPVRDQHAGTKEGETPLGTLISRVHYIMYEHARYERINKYDMFKYIYKHLGIILRQRSDTNDTYDGINPSPISDEGTWDGIIKCIEILSIVSENMNIDIYYNLNSFLTKISVAVTSLENLEMEQLYVRYSPIPFYHTIDLYTLFLSLIQSPMVLTYLKYCHMVDQMDAEETKPVDLSEDVFWLSFKDLWVDAEDIDTILGYYDYLYKRPTTDDQASIGFILDPIKKNPISLIKSVPNEYWNRAWNGSQTNWDTIKGSLDSKLKTSPDDIHLSSGSLTRMPNICLTDKCDSFKMKVHRGGLVFYLNQDMILYNASGVGEKVSAMKAKQDTQNNALKRYIQSLIYSLTTYLTKLKNDQQALANLFDTELDVVIDEDSAKQTLLKTVLRQRRWIRTTYYLQDLSNHAAQQLAEHIDKTSAGQGDLETIKSLDVIPMIEHMPWLIDFISGEGRDTFGEYEFSPDETPRLQEFERMIGNILQMYREMAQKPSATKDSMERHVDIFIKALKMETEGSPIDQYAKHKMNEEGIKVGDITGACRTNIYLDMFKNPTNWDFCYRTDDNNSEIIKEMMKMGILQPFRN